MGYMTGCNGDEIYFLCVTTESYSIREQKTTKFCSRCFKVASLEMFTCQWILRGLYSRAPDAVGQDITVS
jgi:hypothetical protein